MKAELGDGFSAKVQGFVKLGLDHDLGTHGRSVFAYIDWDDLTLTVRREEMGPNGVLRLSSLQREEA